MVSRPRVIAGNWKMYKTSTETESYVKELVPKVVESSVTIFLSVPFTSIQLAAKVAKNSNVVIGAQNMNDAEEGAFTGEIAAKMILDAGGKFVILGHSERREIFHETDEFINKKVKRALADGLVPIVCIGETKHEHEAGKVDEVLKYQLTHSLKEVSSEQMPGVLIAYEPIWAIGTGKTASCECAQESHSIIRKFIAEQWGDETAEQVVIMYGGSVKPNNARELMEQPDIDGLLVGGASLSVDSFSQIVNYETAFTH